MSGRRQRGFTLIELMVSVAIVGILASVAVPSFRNFQLRSRSSERIMLLTSIYRAVDDMYIRDGRFPMDWGGPTDTLLYLMYDQPDAVATTSKMGWRRVPLNSMDHWNTLSISVDGAVYYRYGGYAYSLGTTRLYYLYAYGDLDGDGVQNRWEKQWQWVGGQKQIFMGSTLICGDCSWATETNPQAW